MGNRTLEDRFYAMRKRKGLFSVDNFVADCAFYARLYEDLLKEVAALRVENTMLKKKRK